MATTKVSYEGRRELRWLMVGQCLVTYMDEEIEFADQLWDEWLEAIRRPTTTSIMLCSWGATQPSHQQWRRATRLMRDLNLPVAVVTDARHNLALAKAASWLGTNIVAHRWHDLGAAVRLVGLEDQAISARSRITALRDRFGSVTPDAERFDDRHTLTQRAIEDSSAEFVSETSDEIQRRLAQVKARFQAYTTATAAETPTALD
jgi:gas vesicle protein